MKPFLCCIVLSVLSAQAQTNEIRVVPTNNLSHVRLKTWQDIGIIASNTPAFEQYAIPRMLAEVNSMREKWKLPIPYPLTTNNANISLKAAPKGIDGAVSTKDGRFRWNFSDNRITDFGDTNFSSFSFRYHDGESAGWRK